MSDMRDKKAKCCLEQGEKTCACVCVCAPGLPLALCHCLILTYQFLFLTQSNNAQKIEHLTRQRLRARQKLFHHILSFLLLKKDQMIP